MGLAVTVVHATCVHIRTVETIGADVQKHLRRLSDSCRKNGHPYFLSISTVRSIIRQPSDAFSQVNTIISNI